MIQPLSRLARQEPSACGRDGLTLDQQRILHEVCWDFETQCRDGHDPALETWLDQYCDRIPSQILFAELIGIEVQCLVERLFRDRVDEDTIDRSDDRTMSDRDAVAQRYAARFPDDLDRIHVLWDQAVDSVRRQIESTRLDLTHERYEFIEEIDRGGSGSIWRVHDRQMDREAAVKFLHDSGPGDSMRSRLQREARLCGRLQHPCIVPVYDLAQFPDGRPLIAMKLIRGRTLARILTNEDTGTLADRCLVFEHICAALAHAHEMGIIHRDLKPHNVMVGAFGEVQVMDWGLGKDLNVGRAGSAFDPDEPPDPGERSPNPGRVADFGGVEPTLDGSVVGTPSYMPPEQARGEIDQVDRRSDVFALGGILAAILTGEAPFASVAQTDATAQTRESRLELVRKKIRATKAPRWIKRLALDCLRDDPRDRPRDAGVVWRRFVKSQAQRKTIRRVTVISVATILCLILLVEILSPTSIQILPAPIHQPPSGKAVAMVCQDLIREGKFDLAEDLLRRSLGKVHDHEIGLALGELLRALGRMDESEEILRATWAQFPTNGWVMCSLAKTLAMDNQPDESAVVLEQAIATCPDMDIPTADLEKLRASTPDAD